MAVCCRHRGFYRRHRKRKCCSIECAARIQATERTRVAVRCVQIAGAIVGRVGEQVVAELRSPPLSLASQQERRGSSLRQLLEDLGPVWVKVGQLLANRADLVPPAYAEALESLQTNVRGFPDTAARRLLEAELDAPIGDIFASLSPYAFARASIAQVYKGILRNESHPVAVKVQRPGLESQVRLDYRVALALAPLVHRIFSLPQDPTELVHEIFQTAATEIDFHQELVNAQRFRSAVRGHSNVVVPRVRPEFSTQKVLITEFIDGDELSKIKGTQLSKRIVQIGIPCTLTQVLEAGFYHADPHAGNLLCTRHGQKLCYLDFGSMGEIPTGASKSLVRAVVHFVNKEMDKLAGDLQALGFLPHASSAMQQRKVAAAVTRTLSRSTRSGLSNLSFGRFAADLASASASIGFRVPRAYFLLVKALATLEGIALQADPSFQMFPAVYPWISLRLLTDGDPTLRETLSELLYKDGEFQYVRFESLIRAASIGSVPDSVYWERPFEIVPNGQTGDGDVSTSESGIDEQAIRERRVAYLRTGMIFFLSSEFAFVREALLDELARCMLHGAVQRLRSITRGSLSWLSNERDKRAVAGLQHLAITVCDMLPAQSAAYEPILQGAIDDGDSRSLSIRRIAANVAWVVATLPPGDLLEAYRELSDDAKATAWQLPRTLFQKMQYHLAQRSPTVQASS